jgi:hypothetical protein
MCVRGASALNELLAEFPDARVQVQVVWEPVLKTDIAAPLTKVLGLLDDHRVSQYWDPNRVVSEDLVRAVNAHPSRYRLEEALPPGFIAWDAVAVFGTDARWESELPVPAYYGGPVAHVTEETRESIAEQVATMSGAAK